MMGFARAVSFFLGPVFVLFPILFILVAKFSTDYSHALKWTMFTYAFVLAIALFVVAGVILGFFSNFNVSKKEQRPLLFSFIAFAMFCYFVSIFIFNAPKILFIAFFAIVLCLIVMIIVNRWIKASIHLAIFTGAVIFILVVYGGYSFLLLTLIPLLAWARIKMGEHSLQETIVGTILGIVITLIVYVASRQFFLGVI
ncbi:MAG: hypothetical protein Q8P29_02300 [Candidatus Levybacteria bacterium]|nr:hypothetical protein [Candidatus Levybacteria bacterium]